MNEPINPYAAGELFGLYKMMQKKLKKWLKPCHMVTHLRVLSESYPIYTNMTGLGWFKKKLHPCALLESSLSIGRVKDPILHHLSPSLLNKIMFGRQEIIIFVY